MANNDEQIKQDAIDFANAAAKMAASMVERINTLKSKLPKDQLLILKQALKDSKTLEAVQNLKEQIERDKIK